MHHPCAFTGQGGASPSKLATIFVESEKRAEGMRRGCAFCSIGGASPMNYGARWLQRQGMLPAELEFPDGRY